MAGPTSLICPVLVGREQELEAIGICLREQARPVLVISGEAGIGKSRLARQTCDEAARAGYVCYEGSAFEPDASLPFGPLSDLLRNILSSWQPSTIKKRLSGHGHLKSILPDLVPYLDEPAPRPDAEPEQRKRLIFASLTRLFSDMAQEQPLLLLLEDLHWSDETSLEFLPYFARQLKGPTRLVITYRTEEAGAGLRHFLASLDRARLATEVALDRLSPGDVASMLGALLPSVSVGLARNIDSLSDGNPFFIEEILKALADADALTVAGREGAGQFASPLIPRSIDDAVSRRQEGLTPETRRLLQIAAVAGRRFDLDLLQEAAALGEEPLLAATRELVAAQLVRETSPDQFEFRHAMTQQAVYSRLLERERRVMHKTIGRAAERRFADSLDYYVEELADHFYRGADWEAAQRYARLAAERAQRLHSPRAAVEQYTRALESAEALGAVPDAGLLRQRGVNREIMGDFERALADYERSLELAGNEGNQQARWQVLNDIGLLWASRDYGRALSYFEAALVLAREIGDRALTARSLNRLGNAYVNVDERPDAAVIHEEALHIFEAMGDDRGRAETLDLLGMCNYLLGDVLKSREYYLQAIELLDRLGEKQWQCSAMASCAFGGHELNNDLCVQPPLAAARGVPSREDAVRLAEQLGWAAGEAFAQLMLANHLSGQGFYGRAIEAAEKGIAIADQIEHGQWRPTARHAAGELHLDILDYARARQYMEEARALADGLGSFLTRTMAGPLGEALICLGELDQAAALLSEVMSHDEPAHSFSRREVWFARAQLALARGDATEALRILDLMLAATANLSPGDMSRCVPRISRLRAEVLLTQGRVDEAASDLETALPAASELGARPLIWRLHALLGRVRHEQGRANEAEAEFQASRAMIEELSREFGDEERSSIYVHRASLTLPRPYRARRRTAAAEMGGLTAREREVASLVAQGRSNRGIADELVLSERTVETHISRIMAKLHFNSRSQIASWAVEHLRST